MALPVFHEQKIHGEGARKAEQDSRAIFGNRPRCTGLFRQPAWVPAYAGMTVHTEPGERRLQRQSPQFPEHRVHLAVHEEHGQIARL
jgi:hypothetical protein